MVKLTDEMDRPRRCECKPAKTFWNHLGEGLGCLMMLLGLSAVIFMVAWAGRGFPAFWQ